MFRLRSFGILLSILFFATACTKIDTTRIGSGLIPVVDNINTFDTLLDVTTKNYLFEDSTRLGKSELHALGGITNDPLFGGIDASIYAEMMPSIFPSSFYAKDSLVGLDSIVLSLSYRGVYGDSAGTQPINFRVLKVLDDMHADTLFGDFPAYYKLNQSFRTGAQLGTKSYSSIARLKDSIALRRDSTNYKVKNQVRIPLNLSDPDLLNVFRDSNAIKSSDTAFRKIFKGFKVEATVPGTGALIYISLTDTATRLEFYYRRKIGGTKIDTTSASFFCGSYAGHANNIVRNNTTAESKTNLASDSLVYIFTTPGNYCRISIPGLKSVSNRIIHRAELNIIQIPDPLSGSGKLSPPNYLYLDRFDTAVDRVKYNPIPFDLNPSSSYSCYPNDVGIDYNYFGGILPDTKTIGGVPASVYHFNLTRYVQSIVTKHVSNPDLRLSSAVFAEYFNCTGVSYVPVTGNRVAEGRIKLGGGASRNSTFPYKMKLRIIYSKL